MKDKKDYLIKSQNLLGFLNTTLYDEYDEPTYLTFRVNFFPNNIGRISNIEEINNSYNNVSSLMSYDDMPEPLLEYSKNTKTKNKYGVEVENKKEMNLYSTYDYLLNSLGDVKRANMLEAFISLLIKLNWEFPYYIKSIEGLDNILSVDSKRGYRIKKDAIITLKCYEALDQRITALKTLYKKIAWDDVYQRWVLPDMMRFFRMDIYISEFRIFHSSNNYKKTNTILGTTKKESKLSVVQNIKNTLSKAGTLLGTKEGVNEKSFILSKSSINDYIPTTKIECRMCEFDISNSFSHLSSLSSSPKDKMVDDVEIKIKVGNIREINKNDELYGIQYTDYNEADEEVEKVTNFIIDDKDLSIFSKLDIDIFNDISFIERTGIQGTIDKTTHFDSESKSRNVSYLEKAIKDTLNGALSYADNLADRELNKLMNTPIGGDKYGLSFNDTLTAITSANINTMYDTFKNKLNEVKKGYPEVSLATVQSELNNSSESVNKTKIPISSATDEEYILKYFKHILKELGEDTNATNSTIAQILLDWGESNNISSIEGYIEPLVIANEEIQNEYKSKIESILKNEEETSYATDENNTIDTKIVL